MHNSTLIHSGDETVAVLTLGRAHCLDIAGKHEITETFAQLARHPSLRAVILAASHPAAWLVDVAELAEMTSTEARVFSRAGHRLADTIAALPVPVIAAVDGPALGGGCELVLACDVALAGEAARFGQIEALGGVMPAFGGTWRLARRVGQQRAMLMMLTAEVVDAAAAKAAGLVLDSLPSRSYSTAHERWRPASWRLARNPWRRSSEWPTPARIFRLPRLQHWKRRVLPVCSARRISPRACAHFWPNRLLHRRREQPRERICVLQRMADNLA
jgi:enoyl-CoA hydratase